VLGVGFEIFGLRNVARLLQLVQSLLQRGNSSTRPVATSRIVSSPVSLGFLGEMPDHRPLVALDAAGIRLLLFENDREQRGLAGAVRANERHAVTASSP
jgi:hypothetical protein